MQYRHYSFDLWNTLIKPNPKFKEERLKYLHSFLMRKGKLISIERIERAFEDTISYSNAYSQLFGRSLSAWEMYSMIIFKTIGSLDGLRPLDLELLYMDMEKLFLEYPPTLYDNDTLNVLQELHLRARTMSLLSNTSFTRGKTLDIVLENLGIKDFFLFRLYSDQINHSKPSREAFRMVDDKLPYDIEDIIHVGDNFLTDGIGAQDYGFGYMIINQSSHKSTPDYTIKDLL